MKWNKIYKYLIVSILYNFGFFLPIAAQVYKITDFGAKGDGKTMNTAFIQQAIDVCNKNGDGTVWIPAGIFVCGEIELKSNLTLHLDNGAILLGSPEIKDYPKFKQLIHAENLQNITFSGSGTIDGNGKSFFNPDWTFKPRPEPWIKFLNCQNIVIQEVRLINSPAHVLDFTECEQILVEGISIINDMRSPNTDGIDIRNTRNVRITNCYIETGDDAICLKTSLKNEIPRYFTENIIVSNCILKSDDAALKLGTGSAYLTRNCIFSNCVIQDTRFGIAIFMEEGGKLENYQFNNIIIQGKSRHKTEYPIFMDIDRKKPEYAFGQIKDVQFNDLIIETRGNILIGGQKTALIENISFSNVKLKIKEAVDLKTMKKPKGNRSVPRFADSDDFAAENAHITIGNARNITFKNFTLEIDSLGFKREPMVLKNTVEVKKNDFEIQHTP
ncbi:MAG: glycosyl hydrolase family 28 protein [Microscillaceae bacterium]|jgi:polygalacturonase|nr:glycosyl hydrolase family 28 protein [Microscillaceae bacterium]